jgi:hypothetical protein
MRARIVDRSIDEDDESEGKSDEDVSVDGKDDEEKADESGDSGTDLEALLGAVSDEDDDIWTMDMLMLMDLIMGKIIDILVLVNLDWSWIHAIMGTFTVTTLLTW